MTESNLRFSLTGKTAFVSGAAGRLGSAMVRGLAEAGAAVILNGRNGDALEALRWDLAEAGLTSIVAAFDINDEPSRAEYLGGLSRLDILVNNAYSGKTGIWEEMETDDFRQSYEIAVVSAFGAIKDAEDALVNGARASGQASVINIGSMYGSVSPDFRIYRETKFATPPSYSASKGALLQLTRYAATALAPMNIRVNCISPGPFPPPDIATAQPEFHADLVAKTPLNRIGRPEELIGAVVFLASDSASFVTGAELPVDGGWTAW